MTEAQTMLEPCPFCGKALHHKRGKINPNARCVTEDCYGAKMPVISLDVPSDVEAWNTRASTAAAQRDRCPHSIRRSMCTVCRDAAQPVAWTNKAQLGFLEDPACADVPMAMWSKTSPTSPIPLYCALPASQPDGVRSALEALVNAVMCDISEAKRRLDADRPKDGPVHPVSAFLTGLAIDVGKAQAALSRPAVDGDGREATIRECAEIAENFRRQVLPGDRGIIRKIEEAILALTAQPPKDGSRVPRPERGGSK